MRCVVTYLQNKRISLPYLFNRYCFPAMKGRFPGRMELVHVFHDYHPEPGLHTQLHSNREMGRDALNRVRCAVDDGLFHHAEIVRHSEVNSELSMLPSVRIAAEIGQRADLHLWMEDDAIVHDLDCGFWAEIMRRSGADVGLYRDTDKKEMVNTAYCLTTPDFDRRLLDALKDFRREPWEKFKEKGSQIENLFWLCSKKRVLLDSTAAERHHPYSTFRKTVDDVRRWVRKQVPNVCEADLQRLYEDFQS